MFQISKGCGWNYCHQLVIAQGDSSIIYVIKCKQKLEFPWKSNVVLGSCGSEDFEKKKEANGLKRKILERSDPLKTSNLSLMKKEMSYVGHFIFLITFSSNLLLIEKRRNEEPLGLVF